MDMFRPAPQQPAPAPAQQQQPASQQVVPGSTMNQNNPGADPTKQQGSEFPSGFFCIHLAE